MSVFGGFQEVWSEKYNCELPDAWEEDIRANLKKHKKKLIALKDELQKEEMYVEYLERLVSDIEKYKKKYDGVKDSSNITQESSDENISKVNTIMYNFEIR